MPRKAPNQVIEHRITLGDYERKEIKEALDVRDKQVMIDNAVKGGQFVLLSGAIVGASYITYLALKSIYDFVDDVTPNVKNIIYGQPTYPTKDPPPANKEDWVNRDPENGERINPMHPVPFAGGLVGLGIKAGEAVPVGSWVRSGWDSIFD